VNVSLASQELARAAGRIAELEKQAGVLQAGRDAVVADHSTMQHLRFPPSSPPLPTVAPPAPHPHLQLFPYLRNSTPQGESEGRGVKDA